MRIRFIQAEGGICIYLRGFQETMEPLRSIGGSRLYYYNFIYDFFIFAPIYRFHHVYSDWGYFGTQYFNKLQKRKKMTRRFKL